MYDPRLRLLATFVRELALLAWDGVAWIVRRIRGR